MDLERMASNIDKPPNKGRAVPIGRLLMKLYEATLQLRGFPFSWTDKQRTAKEEKFTRAARALLDGGRDKPRAYNRYVFLNYGRPYINIYTGERTVDNYLDSPPVPRRNLIGKYRRWVKRVETTNQPPTRVLQRISHSNPIPILLFGRHFDISEVEKLKGKAKKQWFILLDDERENLYTEFPSLATELED